LDGFVVLAAADAGGELELLVETTAELERATRVLGPSSSSG